MPTIMVSLRAVDLAQAMTAMRRWLDEHRVQPSLFRYDNLGDEKLAVKLDFAAVSDAEGFAAVFCAYQTGAAAGKRRTLSYSIAADTRFPPLVRRADGRIRRPQRVDLQEPKVLSIPAGSDPSNASLPGVGSEPTR
jgi:hypothetical protein